jgi:hypothetical protein
VTRVPHEPRPHEANYDLIQDTLLLVDWVAHEDVLPTLAAADLLRVLGHDLAAPTSSQLRIGHLGLLIDLVNGRRRSFRSVNTATSVPYGRPKARCGRRRQRCDSTTGYGK